MYKSLIFTIIAVAVALFAQTRAPATVDLAQVDKIFARWNASMPGCAVGVAVDGKPELAKAYGMADLERDVKNTPETIFEAGSVSKQFTAASVLLLARDGKLSLDDPVRKYIPELPDYGEPLRIRHMLTHTSGLRDWGNIEAIAGWPRTSRVYTHAHVLEIVARQKSLNFPPGTRWSYSNSGYNLSAILVSRVSGMPFAEFTRQRLFVPLGLTHTSWRDDHTRIVRNRAIAYNDARDGLHIEMPFENVHGNGGLLTTVGDLLTWSGHYDTPRAEDRAIVAEQQEPGRFSDGRAHEYGLGLYVRRYKGVRQVDHSGSTAGYRADLARYPDQYLSVAVLCNASSAQATQYGRAVADLYLGDRITATGAPQSAYAASEADLAAAAGVYRNAGRGTAVTVTRDQSGLSAGRGQRLVPMSATRFVTASGQTWELNGRGTRITDAFGRVDTLERTATPKPTADELRPLAGVYASDEAETMLTVAVEGDALVIKRRPDTTFRLTPLYPDAFAAAQLGTIVFRRDGGGRVNALSVIEDRVWDLRFARQPARATGSQ